jgi:site-specific DNA-methyltransferase (adenine-specific)
LENTDHPTQKPEKLIAKLVLASSHPQDLVFDPFLGSGTTAAVARKLNRHFFGIELDEYYACLAAKRIDLASRDKTIQGHADGVFWERNTLSLQSRKQEASESAQPVLFEGCIPYKTTNKHKR